MNINEQAQQLHALDAMAVAPEHHEILLENGRVRVLDARVGPGERTPVHTHQWPGVLYVMSWSDFIRDDPGNNVLLDSRNMPSTPQMGQALWSDPLPPHYVHNLGESELRVITIEIKQAS